MIHSSAIVFALLATGAVRCFVSQPGCRIKMSGGLPNNQPLLLQSSRQIYLPNSDGNLDLNIGETIRLVCTGDNNFFDGRIFRNRARGINVTCLGGTSFVYAGQRFDFKQFSCKRVADSAAVRTSQRCSGLGNPKIEYLLEIVFDVENDFRNVILQICFDTDALSVLWTSFKLVSVINGAQKGFDRTTFRDYYLFPGLDINLLYTQRKQNETFRRILGPRRTRELFDFNSNKYLAKGHLTAKTDFVYGSEQDATFAYCNVAPQWQMINQGNWLSVEKKVRELAHNLQSDLQILTGVHGVLRLNSDSNVPTRLYLHADPSYGNKNAYQVPVPALFWKNVRGQGVQTVTVVCVNNPYLTTNEFLNNDDYKLPGCQIIDDSCARHSWLQGIDFNDMYRGYIYCC